MPDLDFSAIDEYLQNQTGSWLDVSGQEKGGRWSRIYYPDCEGAEASSFENCALKEAHKIKDSLARVIHQTAMLLRDPECEGITSGEVNHYAQHSLDTWLFGNFSLVARANDRNIETRVLYTPHQEDKVHVQNVPSISTASFPTFAQGYEHLKGIHVTPEFVRALRAGIQLAEVADGFFLGRNGGNRVKCCKDLGDFEKGLAVQLGLSESVRAALSLGMAVAKSYFPDDHILA